MPIQSFVFFKHDFSEKKIIEKITEKLTSDE